MAEMQILVPKGMLKAAVETSDKWNDYEGSVRVRLEAALRWLSENPTMPTKDDAKAIYGAVTRSGRYFCHEEYIAQCVAEAQRRMFVAPEPELDPLVMYIMRHFDDIDEDVLSRRCRAEAAIKDFQEHQKRNFGMIGQPISTEPFRPKPSDKPPQSEVPEAIKDIWLSERAPNFYVGSKEYNGALLEAFRRGQKAAFSSEKCRPTTVNYSIKCKRPCTRWIYRDGADWPVCDECGSPNLPYVPAVDPSAKAKQEKPASESGIDPLLFFQKKRTDVWADEANQRIRLAFECGLKAKL